MVNNPPIDLKPGDHVRVTRKHHRTGEPITEDITVAGFEHAYADKWDLFWCGWPEGYWRYDEVKVELVKACSDEEAVELAGELSKMRRDNGTPDLRAGVAMRWLEKRPDHFMGAGI